MSSIMMWAGQSASVGCIEPAGLTFNTPELDCVKQNFAKHQSWFDNEQLVIATLIEKKLN